MRRGYLAGPMRGYPDYNFPAFHEAAARGRALGLEIISPAEMDNEAGIDEKQELVITPQLTRTFVRRDTEALLELRAENRDFIALLPRWQGSTGARAELMLAIWLGLEVLDARTFEPFEYEISQSGSQHFAAFEVAQVNPRFIPPRWPAEGTDLPPFRPGEPVCLEDETL